MLMVPSVNAQMSRASVFPEMRSLNPAVISSRSLGSYKLSGSYTTIEKEQKVTNLDGNPFIFNEKGDITLSNVNFFRGGKGGGLTSELVIDHTTGERDSKVSDGSGSQSSYKTETSSSFLNMAFGLSSGLGLGFTYVDYESSYNFQGTFNSQALSESYSSEVNVIGVKPGIVFGSKTAALGLTVEYQKFSTKGAGGAPSKLIFFGAGLSFGSKDTLFEFALEVAPGADTGNMPGQEKMTPMKFSFLTEMKLSFITFGYKLNAYKDGFIELDKVIQAQLIYAGAGDETRLEHIVNFSFGGDKGLNFGVSASYSSSAEPEKSSLYGSTNKHPTETTEMSGAVKIGYVY